MDDQRILDKVDSLKELFDVKLSGVTKELEGVKNHILKQNGKVDKNRQWITSKESDINELLNCEKSKTRKMKEFGIGTSGLGVFGYVVYQIVIQLIQ